ncbi:hypothetical protein ACP275_06G114800 [Erythranthe tilingii]
MLTSKNNLLLSRLDTTCGSLLYELQLIWDEVGVSDAERERILLEIEQECSEVFRKKVDHANRSRAQLRQAIADTEAELATICSAMGERPVHIRQSDQSSESLKTELRAILPQIEEMRKRRTERKNQFIEVLENIQSIKNEINRSDGFNLSDSAIDETDLSMKKLEELHRELQGLQKEKSERLKLVLDGLNFLYSLCVVLGFDSKKMASEIHPSLDETEGSKSISNSTIDQLGTVIRKLRELKLQRMQMLQDLAASLLELWNLMDTPTEEQQIFQKATCKLAASEDEITEPDILSLGYINYVKAEVSRLEDLKASKMKELVLRKKAELEVICRKTRLIPDTDRVETSIDAIESGAIDAACVLEQIELQIARVKEEALSRKEILEKVEKWISACEEESWLEEYNRDDNRYNAGRGAHLTLKRAEKARALVNKLPAMADTLASKIIAWQNENGIKFTYDGVFLLSMLEEYKVLRQEKELERKRQRDQKKLQGQLLAEQETLYGSKPSPMKNHTVKKEPRFSCGGTSNRRLSLGVPMVQTPKPDVRPSMKATPNTRKAKTNVVKNRDRLKDDGLSALSSGRRRLDMTGLPVKQNSLNSTNAHEKRELPLTRKPFSPISSKNSSKPNNAANNLEDTNRKQNEILMRKTQLIVNNNNSSTPLTPPRRICSTADVENRTPPQTKTIIDLPKTPSTVSVPMQTAVTPVPSTQTTVEEEIEYSFEEKRARFVMPRSHVMNVV